MKKLVVTIFVMLVVKTFSQTYPVFGSEIPVTITGLTFDAMEPSITADGNTIFFNSLNDGITTSLYYANRVNDSTFNYVGPLTGANVTTTPRLDAVASSDSASHFYWVSLRNFPTDFDNFHHGTFTGTDVVSIGRLHGTFYIYTIGWLIMDAAINYDGTMLYYCNGYFNPTYSGCAGLPCQAKLGVAQKQNDTVFNKLINSDLIMQNVNDTNYIVYAPFISKNGLELYYTRILKSSPVQSEICVSVRTAITDNFSVPSIIYASPFIPEGSTLTTDQSKMYYHKSVGSIHKLFLRYRNITTGMNNAIHTNELSIYPNPSNNLVYISLSNTNATYSIEVYSALGALMVSTSTKTAIDVSNFANGIYSVKVKQGNNVWIRKFVKE
jgi:Secretion system C-terminal sorting domain/WD40-like Beta Propeller Repeat